MRRGLAEKHKTARKVQRVNARGAEAVLGPGSAGSLSVVARDNVYIRKEVLSFRQ